MKKELFMNKRYEFIPINVERLPEQDFSFQSKYPKVVIGENFINELREEFKNKYKFDPLIDDISKEMVDNGQYVNSSAGIITLHDFLKLCVIEASMSFWFFIRLFEFKINHLNEKEMIIADLFINQKNIVIENYTNTPMIHVISAYTVLFKNRFNTSNSSTMYHNIVNTNKFKMLVKCKPDFIRNENTTNKINIMFNYLIKEHYQRPYYVESIDNILSIAENKSEINIYDIQNPYDFTHKYEYLYCDNINEYLVRIGEASSIHLQSDDKNIMIVNMKNNKKENNKDDELETENKFDVIDNKRIVIYDVTIKEVKSKTIQVLATIEKDNSDDDSIENDLRKFIQTKYDSGKINLDSNDTELEIDVLML